MRRVVASAALSFVAFAAIPAAMADHSSVAALREQIESRAALLDSHTRRLYYEVRSDAEGDDEQAQLLEEVRELWRAARRLNDQTLDGAGSSRLERDVRRVETAFHSVQEELQALREARVAVPSVRKRLQRIDGLVHETHDGVHGLIDREAVNQSAGTEPSTSGYVRDRSSEPLPQVQEGIRRAADYIDQPPVRVVPDGFYFDGRRFTIPLGR